MNNISKQDYFVSLETFESLFTHWNKNGNEFNWNCLFVLPDWLQVWWDVFGGKPAPYICSIRHKDRLLGFAPLMHIKTEAFSIGSPNVCDYFDFMAAPQREDEFFTVLLRHLKQNGIDRLDIKSVRGDSTVLTHLVGIAKQMGYTVACDQAGNSYELALPETWESYLQMLTGKQRHEIRRKTRRLNEAGHISFRVVQRLDELSESMDHFFSMFKASRPDKSEFLTDPMRSFFLQLAQRMARRGFLKIYFLDIDRVPAAAVMCFDFNDTVYLYNSGYDPRFSHLSAGLICKVYSIRNSIEHGKLRYDLLKGDEAYKKRLGSKPVPLYRLIIDLAR